MKDIYDRLKSFSTGFPTACRVRGWSLGWIGPNRRRGLRMVCCVINKANPRVFGVGLHVHYCPLSVLVCWIFTWLFTHEGNKKISRNTCNSGGISECAVWTVRLKQSASSFRFCFYGTIRSRGFIYFYKRERKKKTDNEHTINQSFRKIRGRGLIFFPRKHVRVVAN